MSHLHRELAPITEAAWAQIDQEARLTLQRSLAARRLIDFSGPHGWTHSSVGLGRTRNIAPPLQDVQARLRRTQPLVELRVPFTLSRAELDAMGRGAEDADLDPVNHAAKTAARAEDTTIFEGLESAGIRGLVELGADHAVTLSDDYEKYPQIVAAALTYLRHHGIAGPYAIALGPRCFQGLTETTNRGGYPIMKLVEQQLDGRIVWASALDGALVVSTRGEDFELAVGQDFAIGYQSHDDTRVELYIEESFTFLGRTPEAVVPLRYPSAATET